VLPAGFSALTAEGVLGQPVDDILDRLVSQSLLIVTDDAEGVRFRMLETVREYGLARLADARDGQDDTQDAWAAVFEWMRRLAVDHVSDILDPQAFTTTRAEHDNLLAALRRAIDLGRDADIVLAFSLLAPGWMVRGQFSEMIALVAPALAAAQRLVRSEVQSVPHPASHPAGQPSVPVDALVIALTIGAAAAQYGDTTAALRPLVLLRRVRTRPGISPTLAAVAEIVTAAASVEELHSVVDRLRASDEPEHRLVAELALAQFAENDGTPDVSLAANRRAWELANRRGSVWIAAMAASGVGQLASQSARPAEALVWLDRADEGFRAFGLVNGMQELGWMRAGSLLSLGRIDEARAVFTELAERRELTPDGLELTSVGWFGLAEVTRAEGRADEALDAYRYAMTLFSGHLQRASPWYLMAMSGFLSAGAMDGMMSADELAALARRLRTRALAIGRMHGFVDKPVLGSVLSGVSAWALTLPGGAAIGAELLGLAESIGARQDLPSLRLSDHIAHAAGVVGDEQTRRARDAASGLSADDRVTRARALMSDQALRI
jgi:tetratricopeptide (TPR) repeat protein